MAPPGLTLLLAGGRARLVAPPRALAPGVLRATLVAAVPGLPGSVAACRGLACAVERLRVEVDAAAVTGWVRARLVGATVGGWRVGQVEWDRSEGTGAPGRWALTGAAPAGPVWAWLDLAVRGEGPRVVVTARRCLLVGPPGVEAARTWAALTRRLTGAGVRGEDGRVVVSATAAVGEEFAAAGWRAPATAGLKLVGLRVGAAVAAEFAATGAEDEGAGTWPEGQVEERAGTWLKGQVEEGAGAWPEGQAEGFDPLAATRARLWGTAEARAAADAELRALAAREPGLAAGLAAARAAALRFIDPQGCAAALRDRVTARPDDAAAWRALAVLHARRGEHDAEVAALTGLAALPGPAPAGRRLALALALLRRPAGAAGARALLEPLADGGSPAVWRALARARAGDPAARPQEVDAALAAALGEDGWRRREQAAALRAEVAEALVTSGRKEATTVAALRRVLGLAGRGRRGAGDGAGVPKDRSGARAGAGVPKDRSRGRELRASVRLLADFHAQEGRWRELVALLSRELTGLGGAARARTREQIARIHLHYLHDPDAAARVLAAEAAPNERGAEVRSAPR